MTKITESTWLPLSMVGTLSAAVIGGTIWITTKSLQVDAQAQEMISLRAETEKTKQAVIQYSENLSELKADIKVIRELMEHEARRNKKSGF